MSTGQSGPVASLRRRLAATPPGYRFSIGHVLAIYGALGMVRMLASLDETIVATASPAIASELGGLSSYAWLFAAYTVAATAMVPLYGKLSDVHGSRRLFVGTLAIFLTGSLLCGLAQSMPELIAFRVVQGAGAGALFPLTLTVIAEVVPLRERGRYQGLFVASSAAAAVGGPLLGGFIVDHTSWRWIFLVNLPVGALTLVVLLATIPRSVRVPGRPVDWSGAALLGAAAAALTIGLTAGGHRYPWLSAPVLAALVVAVLAAVAFARHEARVSEPLLSLELLRREPVIASMLSMALAAMVMFGSISYLPLFAQGVLGSSATSSGLVLAPLLVADLLASFLTGQWIARSGRLRPNALLGAVVVCFGLVLCTRMTTASTTADVAHAMMIVGFGLGMMMQVYGMSVQNVAADHEIGSATALTEFSRVVGATLGVTVMGAILNQGLTPGLKSLGGAHPGATDVDPAVRATLAHALEPAFVALLCAGLLLFLVILTRLREIPLRRSAPANRYVERA